jgi:hypothetical protein
MKYTITQIDSMGQLITSNEAAQFVNESTSLALALAYLASVLNFGSITFIDEPAATVP